MKKLSICPEAEGMLKPPDSICSEFEEATNKKSNKEESTRNATGLGNCVGKVIQLELQWSTLLMTGASLSQRRVRGPKR
jgi:hypothetical protein